MRTRPDTIPLVLETAPGVGGLLWRGPGWLYQSPNMSQPDDVKAGALFK